MRKTHTWTGKDVKYDGGFLKWWYADRDGIIIKQITMGGMDFPVFCLGEVDIGMTHKAVQFPKDPHLEIRDL